MQLLVALIAAWLISQCHSSILPIPKELNFFIKDNFPAPFIKTMHVYSLLTEALYQRSLENYHEYGFVRRFECVDPSFQQARLVEEPQNGAQEYATSIWSLESAMRTLSKEAEWMTSKSFDMSMNKVVLTKATISRVGGAQDAETIQVSRRQLNASEDRPDVNIYSPPRARRLDMHAAFLAALEALKTVAVYNSDDPGNLLRRSRTFVTEDYQPHAFLTITPSAGRKLTWRQVSWISRTMLVECVTDKLPFEGQAYVHIDGKLIASATLRMQQS